MSILTPQQALRGLLALFDNEGNFREQHQDQASVAIEAAEAALSETAPPTDPSGDLEILRMALGNTAACLRDAQIA